MADSHYLDSNQYTPQGIQSYELVWGRGFVSPGGADLAREFIDMMGLPADSLVLDLGSGLGGSAFLMATEFNYRVEGLDLSTNMLKRAEAECQALGLQNRVTFELENALEMNRPNRYDGVYSRDAFLHIHDKQRLFSAIHRSLKPRGRLLFTDYCCRPQPWSDGFASYVESHHYCLHTVEDYAGLLEEAGFKGVVGEDLTQKFVQTLESDLRHLSSLADTQELVAAWEAKLERALGGEQRWGLFIAEKG